MFWRWMVAVAVLCLALAGATAAQDLGVWISPDLGVANQSEIDAALAVPLEEAFGMILYKYGLRYRFEDGVFIAEPEEPVFAERSISTCNDLIRWTDLNFVPERNFRPVDSYRRHRRLSSYCYALLKIKNAAPAEVSYLRGFRFGEDALNRLPAMLGPWDCDDHAAILQAHRDDVPWSRYPYRALQEGVRFQVFPFDSDHVAIERTRLNGGAKPEATYFVQAYARGDFNGDGVDDLLVRLEEFGAMFGFYDSELFLLGRNEPDGALRVISIFGPMKGNRDKCRPTRDDLLIPHRR